MIRSTDEFHQIFSFHFLPQPKETPVVNNRRRYGIIHFLFDCFMICITCGFWLVWIYAREMRNR